MLQDVLRRKWWGPPFGVRSQAICRRPTALASGGHVAPAASIDRRSVTASAQIPKPRFACGSKSSLLLASAMAIAAYARIEPATSITD